MEFEKEIKDFLKGKFVYDEEGQYIWLVDENGGQQKIADLRGYGAIQNLFKNKKGEVDLDKANKFQDELGEYLVNLLNQNK